MKVKRTLIEEFSVECLPEAAPVVIKEFVGKGFKKIDDYDDHTEAQVVRKLKFRKPLPE
jgi:hypothetical protein